MAGRHDLAGGEVAFAELAPPRPLGQEAGVPAREPGPFGPIVVEGVTLSYPGSERVALRDVSLRIAPGEVVALVGATVRARPRWPSCELLSRTAIVFQDFIRYAPLVIPDEPTAALDAKAEHELFARIGELFAERSVVPISHRFSTVRSADRIHEELITVGGTYAELFTLQASPYQYGLPPSLRPRVGGDL